MLVCVAVKSCHSERKTSCNFIVVAIAKSDKTSLNKFTELFNLLLKATSNPICFGCACKHASRDCLGYLVTELKTLATLSRLHSDRVESLGNTTIFPNEQ